jgi:hypothetical protein
MVHRWTAMAELAVVLAYQPAAVQTAPHVRGESARATALLRDGTSRSESIRTLVRDIEESDVFVFLDIDRPHAVVRGRTTLLGASAAGRYLHVLVTFQVDPGRQVEMLAHELQHCAEIARAPEVRDAAALRLYMARIGHRLGGPGDFETDAARAIEFVVARELASSARRPD